MSTTDLWGTPASDEVKRVIEAAAGDVERHAVLHMKTKAGRNLNGDDRIKLDGIVYGLLDQRK